MNQQPSIRRTDLHRVWIAPHTPADEDRRVQGDLEHMRDREAIRDNQAMRLQDRHLPRVPGML